MGNCLRCKKNGVFLRVDKRTGLCKACLSEIGADKALSIEKRNELEDSACLLLTEIKANIDEVNNEKSFLIFMQRYIRLMLWFKRACDIEDEIDFFQHVTGSFHRDYDNNVARRHASYRDAMQRNHDDILNIKAAGMLSPDMLLGKIRIFKSSINSYRRYFDAETRIYADKLIENLINEFGLVVNGNEIDYDFDRLDGHAFEYWCADLLKKNGYQQVEVTRGSGDQGVDIIAEKDEIRYAIQCKCYSSNLGNTPVQEVAAGKTFYGCHVGVVMTNRYFTAGAQELAKATGTLLWDRDKLRQLLDQK